MLHICKTCMKRQLSGSTILKQGIRKEYFSIYSLVYNKFQLDVVSPEQVKVASLIKKYEDKILYNGYLEARRLKLGFEKNAIIMSKKFQKERKEKIKAQCIEPIPLSLKYMYRSDNCNNENTYSKTEKQDEETDTLTHFPFETTEKKILTCDDNNNQISVKDDKIRNLADVEIKERLKYLNANNWMTDYDNYDEEEFENTDWKINYGTPDPKSSISNVPCGGCGALLHCRDTSIPGYIPSEIYKHHRERGGTSLQAIICQRCYFLKNYNLALQVQVAPEEYPKVLRTIPDRDKALVILIVDLLDYPCSIWPGAADLLGQYRPIFLVGNKVDLLPQDGKGFLQRVAKHLKNSAQESGFAMTNIKHVALVSATTGFGIEDLISRIFSFWHYNGDVFLVGCTNVGKSSLFNALLQSDFCKSQAVDLIQRATVSPWPGTTLNLLKFPILRPSGFKNYMRTKRLSQDNKLASEENKLRRSQLAVTKNPKYASLIGHIGRTFSSVEPVSEGSDLFSVSAHANASGRIKFGIDERDELYAMSRWCYDTPGVVQPEQLLHLLTAEELVLTLPKTLIRPQTFCIRPGSSIFIAGIGRLDFLEGDSFARFTVFCSSSLPITICKESIADELYEEMLGTEFFAVPTKSADRLKFWPGLRKSKNFTITGIDWNYSAADVVLSSSGWIAIAGGAQQEYQVKAWVPEPCGIHIRDSLLPSAVAYRGRRISASPAYRTDKFYIKQ